MLTVVRLQTKIFEAMLGCAYLVSQSRISPVQIHCHIS